MRLSKQQQLFTQDVAKLILFANSLGVNLTFGEAYRTIDQQHLYFFGYKIIEDNGGLMLRRAPVRSKTMQSNHLRRLAVDFNFFIAGVLVYEHEYITKIGKYWESLSPKNRWGGHFKSIKDTPHFERNV